MKSFFDKTVCDVFADVYFHDDVLHNLESLYKLAKENNCKYRKSMFKTALKHESKQVNFSAEYLDTCDADMGKKFEKELREKLTIVKTGKYDCPWKLFYEFMLRTVHQIYNPTKSKEMEILLLSNDKQQLWERLFGYDFFLMDIYFFKTTRSVKTMVLKRSSLNELRDKRMVGYLVDIDDKQRKHLRETTQKRPLKIIDLVGKCDLGWVELNKRCIWSWFRKEYYAQLNGDKNTMYFH